MAKERKQSADWNIAATHYLTAGLAIPFLVGLAGTLILRILSLQSKIFLSGAVADVISLFLVVLAVWGGVKYSASYLKKTYIIKNKDRIINAATMYMIVLTLGYYLISFYAVRFRGGLISKMDLIYIGVSIAIRIFLFYVFSRKYVKNTEEIETVGNQI